MISEDLRPEKRKREEISRGRRKRRHKEDLRGDKREHSLTESCRVHPPKGFYSEEWDKELQDEDDYQAPDKFQRISRMVFPNGVSWDPPGKHQGGGCSKFDVDERVYYSIYYIRNSTCLTAEWAKKIMMIILICNIFIDCHPLYIFYFSIK